MITRNNFAMLGFCSPRMWSWSRHWTSWAGHLSSKFMQRLQYRNTKITFPKYNHYVNQEIEFLTVKCFASMLIYARWFNVSQFVLSTDFSTTRSFLFRTTRGLLKTRHMWAKLVIRCLSLLLWQANVGVVMHSVAKTVYTVWNPNCHFRICQEILHRLNQFWTFIKFNIFRFVFFIFPFFKLLWILVWIFYRSEISEWNLPK